MLRNLCVFCGSSLGASPRYLEAAVQLGKVLAEKSINLVYGGSRLGLMGTLADACLSAGGNVIGVIPQHLVDKEIAHGGLTELQIVHSMHERKASMAERADAFAALPGGYGTWEEFFEVLTWSQLGLHRKTCGLLNVAGYFDGLIAMADRAPEEGFLKQAHRALLLSELEPSLLIESLAANSVPLVDKWGDRNTSLG